MSFFAKIEREASRAGNSFPDSRSDSLQGKEGRFVAGLPVQGIGISKNGPEFMELEPYAKYSVDSR